MSICYKMTQSFLETMGVSEDLIFSIWKDIHFFDKGNNYEKKAIKCCPKTTK